jgi:hypothetical protein
LDVSEPEYLAKVAEVDRLLNDPSTTMSAELVWQLLDELSSLNSEAVE